MLVFSLIDTGIIQSSSRIKKELGGGLLFRKLKDTFGYSRIHSVLQNTQGNNSFSVIHKDCIWYTMMLHDTNRHYRMFQNDPWCSTILHEVRRYFRIIHDAPRYSRILQNTCFIKRQAWEARNMVWIWGRKNTWILEWFSLDTTGQIWQNRVFYYYVPLLLPSLIVGQIVGCELYFFSDKGLTIEWVFQMNISWRVELRRPK